MGTYPKPPTVGAMTQGLHGLADLGNAGDGVHLPHDVPGWTWSLLDLGIPFGGPRYHFLGASN